MTSIASVRPHKVALQVYGEHIIGTTKSTAVAITPGHLLELTSSGTVQKHSSNGAAAIVRLAIQKPGEGALETAYSASDMVDHQVFRSGDEVYVLLKDGANAVIGDKLVSNADGTFDVLASTEVGLLEAIEAKNLTASANTTADRIMARVL